MTFLIGSRINHSCFPNLVFVAGRESGRFQALRPIKAGEELLHFFLGKELLLPSELRRRHLWRSKCFKCLCKRCEAQEDPTSRT